MHGRGGPDWHADRYEADDDDDDDRKRAEGGYKLKEETKIRKSVGKAWGLCYSHLQLQVFFAGPAAESSILLRIVRACIFPARFY